MEDLLISTLQGLYNYPVFLQGALLDDEAYPDNFFTFWNRDSYGNSFYDNAEESTAFVYDVNFYSINAEAVYRVLREVITELKKAGFIISGDGHSIASDEPTHDGRGVTVYYLKPSP